MAQIIPPALDITSFNCPLCGAFSGQEWLVIQGRNKPQAQTGERPDLKPIKGIEVVECYQCKKYSVWIDDKMVYPKTLNRNPIPPEVSDEFAKDYIQACLVLSDSPKASSALSRRCLQHILREKLNVKKSDLAKEIEEVIEKAQLPTYLLESIDAIRNIGNFAAHPIKSQSSGEIFDVEPGEAEWNLDVLELLFDYLFVQPELLKNKKQALNAKLSEAGKPKMK
jgi:endogenous inhibitor of DNA gyrase (YacG/DUF329 family)